MTETPDTAGQRIGSGGVSRRSFLVTAGVLGTGTLDRGLAESWVNDVSATGPHASNGGGGNRDDFLWLGAELWRNDAIRRNLYAFARRHDLAVVLVARRSPGEAPAELLGPALDHAAAFGLSVWLNVGLLTDLAAASFVNDEEARTDHLNWLRSVAGLHGESFDSGRIVLWQEAPVMGRWSEDGAWNQAAVDSLRTYGPEIFASQKRAIQSANDALDVGPFVHFPYIVDSKQPEVFRSLAAELLATTAQPDFGFVDFYRGWYEKDVGPDSANDAVRSLVTNARAGLDDRPVFYLGQSHTINPKHTPSKQAIRMNLRTSIDADAAGLGWYARNRYLPTQVGFDPFVPNVAGAQPDGDAVNTVTVARDRFLYAWLATLARRRGFDAEDAFDLWLVGDDFGLYDHRLSLHAADGEWKYVGDVGGYVEGDFPERSAVTQRATALRALDRDRFLASGELVCRLETDSDASETKLRSAFVMPCDPDNYVPEQSIEKFARGDEQPERVALGDVRESILLEPGTSRTITVPTDRSGSATLRALTHPEYVDVLDRLTAFEAEEDVDPPARFDCWIRGTNVDRTSTSPSLLDPTGTTVSATDAAAVTTASESVAIYHGLERERFLGDEGLRLAPVVPSAIDAYYAMPYAGSTTFRSPTAAGELLREQPDAARTFSLDFGEGK